MNGNLFITTNSEKAAQVAAGVNFDKALRERGNVAAPFEFPVEKTGIFATLFPSDSTYHPLYEHDYKEIAQNLFGIETMKISEPEKHVLIAKAKDIVIGSYYRGAMASFYNTLIIMAIIICIKLYFSMGPDTPVPADGSHIIPIRDGKTQKIVTSINTLTIWSTIFKYSMYALSLMAVYKLVYANVWAQGEGEVYWQAFNGDLTTRLNNGDLPEKIMNSYGNVAEKEKDRIALAQFHSSTGNVSTGTNSFLGGVLGGIAGSVLMRR
jgi:hypothetical protein